MCFCLNFIVTVLLSLNSLSLEVLFVNLNCEFSEIGVLTASRKIKSFTIHKPVQKFKSSISSFINS